MSNVLSISSLTSKQQLRQWSLSQSPSQALPEQAAKVQRHLMQWPPFLQAQTILFYWAKESELDLAPLVKRYPEKDWYLPRIGEGYSMQFYRYCVGDELERNQYGIAQPFDSAPILAELDQIDLVLIPGLAFDRWGHRIGHGKGYYDRFVAAWRHKQPSFSAKLVGVALDHLLFSVPLPTEPHDAPLTHLVTESGLQLCQQ